MIINGLNKFNKISVEKSENKTSTPIEKQNKNITYLPKVNSALLNVYNNIITFGCANLNNKMIENIAKNEKGCEITEEEKNLLKEEESIKRPEHVTTFFRVISALNQVSEQNNNDAMKKTKILISNDIKTKEDIQTFIVLTNEKDEKGKAICTYEEAIELLKEINSIDFLNLTDKSKEKYYSEDLAMNILKYKIKETDRDKLVALTEKTLSNNKKLTIDEAITCLTYKLENNNQIESFIKKLEKEYEGNKLSHHEAALCTIQELDDKEITKAIRLKKSGIKYKKNKTPLKLSAQEAILLTKLGFADHNIFLNMYASFRKKFFLYESVRQHGEDAKKNFSIKLIFKYMSNIIAKDFNKFSKIINSPIFIKPEYNEFFSEKYFNKSKKEQKISYRTLLLNLPKEEKTESKNPSLPKLKNNQFDKNKFNNNILEHEINVFENNEFFTKTKQNFYIDNFPENKNLNIDHLKSIEVNEDIILMCLENTFLMRDLSLINNDVFWEGVTGESKNVFDLFSSVLTNNSNFEHSKLKENDFDNSLTNNIFNFQTGELTDNLHKYAVKIEKVGKDNNQFLIIKNTANPTEQYIAYDGAITLARDLEANIPNNAVKYEVDSSFKHFSNTELKALNTAAKHFPLDIFENGKCIISEGISSIEEAKPFNGRNKETDKLKEHYSNILQKLHENQGQDGKEQITVENILRLMPKNAILQIRPYSTRTSDSTEEKQYEILYSISAEWKDANGKDWQLRIHSHDLKFPQFNKKWIYRLGYTDDDTKTYFYNPKTNNWEEGNKNAATHVQIENESKINGKNYSEYLLANPYFQKTIRDISISFNQTQIINNVSKELKISLNNPDGSEKQLKNKKDEIIEKCEENTGYYYKYKEFIDKLLQEQGLEPFCE